MSLSKHRCDVCDLSFTSYQHYSIHLGGLLHKEKQRRKLEAQDDFAHDPSRLQDSTTYPKLSSNRYPNSYVDSVSTGLHSCLKQPKTSSQQSHYSSVAVAFPQTDVLHSSHFSSFFDFLSSTEPVYKDSWQLAKKDANDFESYSSQGLNWRKDQNSLPADKMTEVLAKPPSSSAKRSSKEKSSILTLLAAQRLLKDNSLGEKSPKKPPKTEAKSKDSVRNLLSAQFDLLKSYMTEPQTPVKPSEPEKAKASPGQDLSRLRAVERSDASLSTMVGVNASPGQDLSRFRAAERLVASLSTMVGVKASPGLDLSRLRTVKQSDASLSTMAGSTLVQNIQTQHSLEAADQYSTTVDQSMGKRSQGLVKPTSDFWSRQATYADEVQNDPSSIPFLGEGCAKDGCLLEEQKASFLPHSLDQVTTSTWDRNEDNFVAGQRDRSSDHAMEKIRAEISKRTGPTKSDGLVSSRPWLSRRHHEVKSSVPSDVWKQREDRGLESIERTYSDELQHDPKLNYYKSLHGKPLLSSENETHLAAGAYQQQMPSFRDEFRQPVPLLSEKNKSQSSIEDFMAEVKKNLQRDLKYDSLLTSTSRSEEKTDSGRSYPVTSPLQSNMTQRKVLLQTPQSSESLGTSSNISTTISVLKRKTLLPTPVADTATPPQSSATSLPSSSTGSTWSQPDGKGGIPSQQRPRFISSTCGGGRFNSADSSPSLPSAGKNMPPVLQPRSFNPGGRFQNDSTFSGSTAVSSTTKKTLLSTPPVGSMEPGSCGRSSSSAGALNSAKESPSQAVNSVNSSPLSRSIVADKLLDTSQLPVQNMMKAIPNKTSLADSPSQAMPIKSSPWRRNVVAAQPQPAGGKLEAVSTCGSQKTSNEPEEVDPQFKLQKEIEMVMAERVEDLMRVIPDSMMRSIMDGKVPLEFLDKISDLIPTQVIEEAVKQMEQSAADDCTAARAGHTETRTSQKPLLESQAMVVAQPETNQGSGAESRSGRGKMEEPHLECTAITEGLNLGGKAELVKKVIDEILGDLANVAGAPSNTDVLDKLAPNDRSLVLEMQDVAGIRDVSVIVELLEFFKTLDRSLILTLSTTNEREKEGEESVLKRMTRTVLKYLSKNDSSTRIITGEKSQKSPTHSSGIVTQITCTEQSQKFQTENVGPRNFVQPCMTNSPMVFGARLNKAVAVKKPELHNTSLAPRSSVTVSEKQIVKGSTDIVQNKTENPEIKTISIPLSEIPDFKASSSIPRNTAGIAEKPEIKTPSVLPPDNGSVSETLGSKSLSNAAKNLIVVAKNSETKAASGLNQNNNLSTEKTPKCAAQNKASVSASKIGFGSVATIGKSELQGSLCNPQNEVVATKKPDTKSVASMLQNVIKRNEQSTIVSVSVPVEKKATVGVTSDSEISSISQKTTLAVAGKPELTGAVDSNSTYSLNILNTPEVKSSPAVQEKTTSSDKFEVRDSSAATQSKTETVEKPELKVPCRTAQNKTSNEETVTSDIQQTKATVAALTASDIVASSVVVEQSKSSSTDQTESDKQTVSSSSGLPSTQPCTVDTSPEEPTSNEKAEKRKATQPEEPNKRARLETTSAIVSAKPAATLTTSTAVELQPKTSYAAPVSSAVGQSPQDQFASPKEGLPQQSIKPKVALLPTPEGPSRSPVPLLSPLLDVWHKRPLLRVPFPPRDLSLQRPQLPRAVVPLMLPGLVEQEGLPPAPHVQPVLPAHRQLRPLPRKLLHPPEEALNRMPRIRARAPPPRLMRMQPPDAPFRARNCAPMNTRPLLPNPTLHQPPPRPLVHADNSFQFPGPKLDVFGPPPFKRWR